MAHFDGWLEIVHNTANVALSFSHTQAALILEYNLESRRDEAQTSRKKKL